MAGLITRRGLLVCGVVAGPLLLVILLVDGATQPGMTSGATGSAS